MNNEIMKIMMALLFDRQYIIEETSYQHDAFWCNDFLELKKQIKEAIKEKFIIKECEVPLKKIVYTKFESENTVRE